MATEKRLIDAELATHCLICNAPIPLCGVDFDSKICSSCRNSFMEFKNVLSELKKMANRERKKERKDND